MPSGERLVASAALEQAAAFTRAGGDASPPGHDPTLLLARVVYLRMRRLGAVRFPPLPGTEALPRLLGGRLERPPRNPLFSDGFRSLFVQGLDE